MTLNANIEAKIEVYAREIRGVKYGAGSCYVQIGPGRIEALAVLAGECKHVNLPENCERWLVEHGLSVNEAKELIHEALEHERAERLVGKRLTQMEDEERQGLYEEEVDKLVDGVLSDIENGYVHNQQEAHEQLVASLLLSSWVNNDALAQDVLKFGGRVGRHEAVVSLLTGDCRTRLEAEVAFQTLPVLP